VLIIFGPALAIVGHALSDRTARDLDCRNWPTLIFGAMRLSGAGTCWTERGHVNVDIIYGQFFTKRKAPGVDIS